MQEGVSEILGGPGGAGGSFPPIPPCLSRFQKFWTHPQPKGSLTLFYSNVIMVHILII